MGVPALIVAAGSGLRLGAGGPKALVPLEGRPLYEWSVEAFQRATSIDRIVVVVPPRQEEAFSMDGIEKVVGGASRSESVANAVAHLTSPPAPVLDSTPIPVLDAKTTQGRSFLHPEGLLVVHDAARPLVTPELIDSAVEALESDPALDAVIAAAPVTDTIKRIGPDRRVVETLDRSELVSVQTPQVFRIEALRRAIASGDLTTATDDASLIEASSGSVGVIDAPSGNIKVTVPGDLDLAARLLERNR